MHLHADLASASNKSTSNSRLGLGATHIYQHQADLAELISAKSTLPRGQLEQLLQPNVSLLTLTLVLMLLLRSRIFNSLQVMKENLYGHP